MDLRELSETVATASDLSASQAETVVETIVTTVSTACLSSESPVDLDNGELTTTLDKSTLVDALVEKLNLTVAEAANVLDLVVSTAAAV